MSESGPKFGAAASPEAGGHQEAESRELRAFREKVANLAKEERSGGRRTHHFTFPTFNAAELTEADLHMHEAIEGGTATPEMFQAYRDEATHHGMADRHESRPLFVAYLSNLMLVNEARSEKKES